MLRNIAIAALALAVAAPASAINLSTEIIFPAAARGAGAPGSFWQMDLFLINPGSEDALIQIYWLDRNKNNSGATPINMTVRAGQEVVLFDVILNTLGQAKEAGAFRILSDVPIAGTSRIYNSEGGKFFAQGFEGLTPAAAIGASSAKALVAQGTSIPGMVQNANNRSNIFALAGPIGADFTVVARSLGGADLGQKSYSIKPWSAFYAAMTDIVSGSPGNFFVDIDVSSGSAWFVGARADQNSGDPLTLAALGATEINYDAADFDGTYIGTWINTTFASSGAATITIDVDTTSQQVDFTADMDGLVFGSSNPPAESYSGPYGPSGIHLTGSSATFGDVVLDISSDGLVTGSGTSVPDPSIDSVSFMGAVSPDSFVLNYRVFFTGSGTADGVLTLTKML